MTRCEECGLPIAICNALSSYRRAIEYWNDNKLDQAQSMIEFAEEEYNRYLMEWKQK